MTAQSLDASDRKDDAIPQEELRAAPDLDGGDDFLPGGEGWWRALVLVVDVADVVLGIAVGE